MNEGREIALLREGSIVWKLVKTIIENKGERKKAWNIYLKQST